MRVIVLLHSTARYNNMYLPKQSVISFTFSVCLFKNYLFCLVLVHSYSNLCLVIQSDDMEQCMRIVAFFMWLCGAFFTVWVTIIPETCFYCKYTKSQLDQVPLNLIDGGAGRRACLLLIHYVRSNIREFISHFSVTCCPQKGFFRERRCTDNEDICCAPGASGGSFMYCGK